MFSTQFNATKRQLAHGAHRGHGSNNSYRQLSAFHRIHLHGRYASVVDAFPAENINQSIQFRTTTATIKRHRWITATCLAPSSDQNDYQAPPPGEHETNRKTRAATKLHQMCKFWGASQRGYEYRTSEILLVKYRLRIYDGSVGLCPYSYQENILENHRIKRVKLRHFTSSFLR